MTNERDETGSALILALAIITAIGLMMAAILSFTETSLLATPKFVSNRNTLYDVDGAVDGAINALRGSLTLGNSGPNGSCPTYTPDSVDMPGVTVECTAEASSGTSSDDVPPYAVLLLGPGGFVHTGTELLTIDGGIYSNGPIDLASAGNANKRQLQVYGDVFAEGACSPVSNEPESISSVGGLRQCGNDPQPFTGNASGDDPGYSPGVSSISGMSVDPVATCASANSLVAFSPGLYSEVPVAPSGCSGSVWWFKPGVYYFDFPAGRHTWDPAADNIYILGGTLASGLDASSNSNTVAASFLGKACDEEATGVQFIFGGASLLEIKTGGYVDVCGSTATTNNANHRIAFYGLNDTHGAGPRVTRTSQTRTQDGTPSTATGSDFPWVAPEAAQSIDGVAASAAVTGSNKSADLLIPSFADIPAGSTVTSVKVRVKHYAETLLGAATSAARPSFTLSLPALPNGRAATTTSAINLTPDGCTLANPCVDEKDVTSQLSDDFGYLDVNQLVVNLKAGVQGNNTIVQFVDGVELVVSYTEPGFQKLACVTAGCSVITSTVAQNIFFHGTVYAPTASLNIRVHNNDTTIFDRGVIASSLTVNLSNSSKQVDSPFQLPAVTTSRTVLFIGKVDGVEKIRARVKYQDFRPGTGGDPDTVFPGYEVKVLKWSVLR